MITITDPTLKENGTFRNGCTRHTVTWEENGVTKKRHFRKSYSAQRFVRALREVWAGQQLEKVWPELKA